MGSWCRVACKSKDGFLNRDGGRCIPVKGAEKGLLATKHRAGLGPPSLHGEDNSEHLVLPFAPSGSDQVKLNH